MARRSVTETSIKDPGTRIPQAQTNASPPTTKAQAPQTEKPKANAVEKGAIEKGAKPRAYVVRPGRVLMWPNGTVRGKPGYCVSAEDPFIKGFEAVLAPAPKGTVPNAIDDPVYTRLMAERKRDELKKRTSAKDEDDDGLNARGNRRRQPPPKSKRPPPELAGDVTDDSIPDVNDDDADPDLPDEEKAD